MPRSKEAAMRRKKKAKFIKKECPFPIPMPSSTGVPVGSWFYYTGFIEGSTVVVRHTGDMDFLYRMGFFGKGTLSRSQPNFSERRQRVNIELPERNGQYKLVETAVVNKRSYLAHKRFKALADGRMKEYNDIVYQEEQQQGFVDSSEEEKMDEDSDADEEDVEEDDDEEEEDVEEEDDDEEEDDEEEDDDDDSVSSADIDSGKRTAFKLLNLENSSFDSGQKNPGTSSTENGDSVGMADISAEVRSHIVSMLAKISLLSNEQITTFMQVPEDMKHLAERYKKMRKVEVNMLQQAFAAKFPGRNFKKGEVITLDEDDCAPDEGRPSGNVSDNAVVISDSDDGDGEDKSGNDVSRSKRPGFDYDDSVLSQAGEKSLNESKDLSKKAVSSKRDLADWSSDDSNFWSEEPQVPAKNTPDILQTTTGEEMIVQDRASSSVDLCNDEGIKKSVDANNEGEIAVSIISDQQMTETDLESVANKCKKEDGSEVGIQQTDTNNMAECNIVENKHSVKTNHQDANGEEVADVPDGRDNQPNSASSPCIEDNASIPYATNSSDDSVRNTESLSKVCTDDKSVVKGDDKLVAKGDDDKLVVKGDDELVMKGDDDKLVVKGDDELVMKGDDDKLVVKGDDDKLVVKGDDDKLVVKGEDDKLVAKGDDKLVAKGDDDKLVVKGDDELVMKGDDDTLVVKGDDELVVKDDDDKLVVKGDDKQNDSVKDSINTQIKKDANAVSTLPSENGSTYVSFLKNNLDIKQENSLNSSDFSMETDGSKAGEASKTSEEVSATTASVSECVEMLDQTLEPGVGQASVSECVEMLDQTLEPAVGQASVGESVEMLDQTLEPGVGQASVGESVEMDQTLEPVVGQASGAIDKAECGIASPAVPEAISLDKENQSEDLDSVLRIGSSEDVAKDMREANSSHHAETCKQFVEIGQPDTESHNQSKENNLLDSESHKQTENNHPDTESHEQSEENSHLDTESHKQSKENCLPDTESHKQFEEKSKTTNVFVGLQIETSVRNESGERDKSLILSNSVESVTHIDSDNSNDSDDVICIESKSAEPKKLHNFLSQPVKKISVPVITKSVTFMSAITEEPTFVSASVGFQSWGPLLHFNFTGDPSHLPAVMAVSSSPPPSAGQRAPQNGQSQHPDIVYERIYPPIKSLVPNVNSTGAVIKQRLKGLPILNTAYSQILQAHEAGTATASLPQKNHVKELTASKPLEHRFQPYPKTFMDQRQPALSSTLKTAQPNLLDSRQSSRQASSDAERIKLSHVLSYIDAYQSASTPPPDKTEMQDGTENVGDISSVLVSLSSIIVKISKLYNAVSAKESPDITTEDQEKHNTEIEKVLAEFHLALSHYVSCVEISSTLEMHLLALLLSEKENNSENISSKDMMEAKSRLSAFHIWLLKKRFEYLKKDQRAENRHDLQKVVVVDLTNNSDDKVHILHPPSGFAGNMVVDLTEKSDKLNDPLNDSKLETIIDDDLIVDQAKEINTFVKKSNIENDSLLDSDDSLHDSDGSRQQSQVKSEADSLQTANSESKSESVSEENVMGEMSEEQSCVSSTEDCKKESLSQENVCKSLHDVNADGVNDGIVCNSLSEAVTEKLNAEHVSDDNLPEENVVQNLNEEPVCKSLVEGIIGKSEDSRQNNEEVVSEETLKHSQKTLETENRKRKFARSHDEASEVNGKKLKSDEDQLLDLDEVDEKAGISGRREDHAGDTDDTTEVGANGCPQEESESIMEVEETTDSLSKAETSLEVLGQVSCLVDKLDVEVKEESKSLMETEETTDSLSKAETGLGVLGQASCLLDKLDVKVCASQELGSSGQLSLDSGDLLCKNIDHGTIETDLLLAKEEIGCVKDEVDNSCVSSMEVTTPTEVEHVKMESSDSPDASAPSCETADVEIKKEDQLLKETQSSLGNEGDSSIVILEDDADDKMDITTTCDVKQEASREAAERMSSNTSSVTGLKTEQLTRNGEGSLQKGATEQSTEVVNCLVSSESDSEDVSCISAIEKPRPPAANKEVNSLLKKLPERKEAPETSGKGSLQKPGTSKDIHIFIGSSSDEAEEPPAKKHTSRQSSTRGAHPYSARDDPDGNLFVVANTSDEDYEDCSDEDSGEEGRVIKRRQQWWRSCVKKDPYPTEEKLHLMLEEAFFLSFGLGCLRVLDPEMKLLDLTQMWQQFQVLKENFLPHYAAYHYFRSKGWVPKSGLKFGCDLILYREGPPFYHGSYSVVVIAVKDATLLPVNTHGGIHFNNRKLNWVSLAGLNRITEHVAKELMLCYVIWPANMTYEESLSPDCISRFKVKELVVSRWVSSQERENKFGEEEMP